MRTRFAWLVLFGAAMVLSGCAERHYRPYYYDGGYYRGDRHHRDHDRWRDEDRHHRDDDR